MIKPLQIRKLADKSDGERVRRFHPDTGEPHLVNPETGQPEPWPLLGVEPVGDLPKQTRVPTTWVTRGIAEGWIELENPQMVHRPGGPPEDPWRITHTFTNADAIILKTPKLESNIKFRVKHNPDKYAEDGDDQTPVTPEVYSDGATRVDWFYDLELVKT